MSDPITLIGDASVVITLVISTVTIQRILLKMQRTMDMHQIEHEILLADYCTRHSIELRDLPTRSSRR